MIPASCLYVWGLCSRFKMQNSRIGINKWFHLLYPGRAPSLQPQVYGHKGAPAATAGALHLQRITHRGVYQRMQLACPPPPPGGLLHVSWPMVTFVGCSCREAMPRDAWCSSRRRYFSLPSPTDTSNVLNADCFGAWNLSAQCHLGFRVCDLCTASGWRPTGASLVWQEAALRGLDADLQARYGAGAAIIFRNGPYLPALQAIAAALNVGAVYYSRRSPPLLQCTWNAPGWSYTLLG